MKFRSKDFIFYSFVLFLSILNIYNNLYFETNLLSLLISCIGLTSYIVYFIDFEKSRIFMRIWIFSQFPIVLKSTKLVENNIIKQTDATLFDVSQVFKIHFDISINDYSIGINIIALIYLIIYKIVINSKMNK